MSDNKPYYHDLVTVLFQKHSLSFHRKCLPKHPHIFLVDVNDRNVYVSVNDHGIGFGIKDKTNLRFLVVGKRTCTDLPSLEDEWYNIVEITANNKDLPLKDFTKLFDCDYILHQVRSQNDPLNMFFS